MQLCWRNGRLTCGGVVFAFAGFPGVVVLLGLSALLGVGLALRVRA
jgi:hypothetical protein